MIVMESQGQDGRGDGNAIVIAVTMKDLQTIQDKLTLVYEQGDQGHMFRGRNIVIMFGQDKEDVIRQLEAGGVKITEAWKDAYRRGDRTDRPVGGKH